MNTILLTSKKMPFHTDLRKVFEAIGNRQTEFNWLITDLECNCYPDNVLMKKIIRVSGNELTEIVSKHDIQFIWGVLSAFSKTTSIDLDNLEVIPYADGNPGFWVDNTQIQHPKALIEIVCFDSSLTLLLSKDENLTRQFRMYFPEALDLNEYNSKYSTLKS